MSFTSNHTNRKYNPFIISALSIRIRDNGKIWMTASGITARISVRIGNNIQGKPTIQTTRCSARIGSVKVKIGGSWLAWLYNLFRGRIARMVKGALEKRICEGAQKAINTNLNQQLAELKVVNTIDNTFVFDYRLLRAPKVGRGYVQTMQKGEVRSRINSVPFSAAPVSFPPPSGPTKMVYIWGSDYVINSYAFTAFRLGLVQYNYSSQNLPANIRRILKIHCSASSFCLGTLFPAVATMFPNHTVDLVLRAVRAPYITTTPQGINLTLPGEVSVRATSPAGQTDPILKVGLSLNMSVNAWLGDRVVRGSVANFKPKFTVIESVIPDIPDSGLQGIFERLLKPSLLKNMNELGRRGIEVPDLKQIKFVRPVLKLNKGSVMFGTDIDWQSLVS